ncbi:MAG: hypothetical protein QHH05_00330 [Syntrophomonadaceae bacterium]|nr:hypothetical protein [Syntrophomonadaceae bacterium]MDH7496884.1 hypothetical protein [Syntrophomonadaceae bacterium]
MECTILDRAKREALDLVAEEEVDFSIAPESLVSPTTYAAR